MNRRGGYHEEEIPSAGIVTNLVNCSLKDENKNPIAIAKGELNGKKE
jgi:hypothetical protein